MANLTKREKALIELVLPYLEHPDVIAATKGFCRPSDSIAEQIRREASELEN